MAYSLLLPRAIWLGAGVIVLMCAARAAEQRLIACFHSVEAGESGAFSDQSLETSKMTGVSSVRFPCKLREQSNFKNHYQTTLSQLATQTNEETLPRQENLRRRTSTIPDLQARVSLTLHR